MFKTNTNVNPHDLWKKLQIHSYRLLSLPPYDLTQWKPIDFGALLIFLPYKARDILAFKFSVYDFPVIPKECCLVFGAIPDGTRMLNVFSQRKNRIIPSLNPGSIFIGNICSSLSNKPTNQYVKNIIQRNIVSKSTAIFYWHVYEDIDWKTPGKCLLINKIHEVTFKLLHRCYPVKINLKKYLTDIATQ